MYLVVPTPPAADVVAVPVVGSPSVVGALVRWCVGVSRHVAVTRAACMQS